MRWRYLLTLFVLLGYGCISPPPPVSTPVASSTPAPSPTPTPDVALLAAGWEALERGDLEEAERIANQVLAGDEYAAEAWALRGQVHYQRYENEAAIADLEQARNLGYETSGMLENLVVLYTRRCSTAGWNSDQYEDCLKRARQVSERLLEIDPDNFLAKDFLSVLDAQVDWGGHIEEADPRAVEHYTQAEKYFAQGLFEQAIAEYKAAIEIDPAFSKAYLYLGDAYYAQERYMEALPWFEQAVHIEPGLIQGWVFLGDAYWHLGLVEHAREAYSRALLLFPDYETARRGMDNVEEFSSYWRDTYFCPYGFRFGYFRSAELTQLTDVFGPLRAEAGAVRIQYPGVYLIVLTWQPFTTTVTTERLSEMATAMLAQWDVERVGEPQEFPYGSVPMVYQLYRYTPSENILSSGAQANWTCDGTLFIAQMEITGAKPEEVPSVLFTYLENFRCRCGRE